MLLTILATDMTLNNFRVRATDLHPKRMLVLPKYGLTFSSVFGFIVATTALKT